MPIILKREIKSTERKFDSWQFGYNNTGRFFIRLFNKSNPKKDEIICLDNVHTKSLFDFVRKLL